MALLGAVPRVAGGGLCRCWVTTLGPVEFAEVLRMKEAERSCRAEGAASHRNGPRRGVPRQRGLCERCSKSCHGAVGPWLGGSWPLKASRFYFVLLKEPKNVRGLKIFQKFRFSLEIAGIVSLESKSMQHVKGRRQVLFCEEFWCL